MNFKFYSILILMLHVFMSSCGSSSDSRNNRSRSSVTRADIVKSAFIDIPSAISVKPAEQQSNVVARETLSAEAPVTEIYETIRKVVGGIEGFIPGLKEITEDIYSIIGEDSSGDWIDDIPEVGEPDRVIWGPVSGNYNDIVEVYFDGQKGFEALLTVNEQEKTAKGIYTWDLSVENPTNDVMLQVLFDSSTEPKTLEIKLNGAVDSFSPANAWLKVKNHDDNVVDLWGNLYFPTLDLFNDNTGDASIDRNYVFVAIGYDETGQDAGRQNKVILQLALPPSETATSDVWEAFSVGAIFVDQIKNIWTSQDLTVDTLEILTGIQDLTGPSIMDLTYDDVLDILNWAADNTGDTDLDSLTFVTQLVNPAYFDYTGFVGTCMDASNDGVCDAGSLGNIPSSFDELDIAFSAVDIAAPNEVKELIVNFSE
jgi:hypothetical protein